MPENRWSDKRERQYSHIKSSLKTQGKGEKLAEEIAARTVNKERARHGEALQGAYHIDAVLDRLDAMLDETADSALRDELRWAAQYQSYGGWNWRDDFTNYDEEVEYLRQWIIDRWAFVDAID